MERVIAAGEFLAATRLPDVRASIARQDYRVLLR
jgi:hypothetical protein